MRGKILLLALALLASLVLRFLEAHPLLVLLPLVPALLVPVPGLGRGQAEDEEGEDEEEEWWERARRAEEKRLFYKGRSKGWAPSWAPRGWAGESWMKGGVDQDWDEL